jgi:hypothetical protein
MVPAKNMERRIITANSINNIKEFILQRELLPQFLRRLCLQLSTSQHWSVKRLQWLEPDRPESDPADRESFLTLIRLFPLALEKLEWLESLWLNFIGPWESEYSGFEGDEAPQFDLVAVDELRRSLCSLFSPFYHHKFQFLTELRLVLPCAYDFAALNNAMSNDATQRLKHLYLEYVDATGPGGTTRYLSWAEDWDGIDNDEFVPLSNLQQQYLNYDYMPEICKLVSRCFNLETLGLQGTHLINLDDLDWNPSGSGLKNLYIGRAMVPFHSLRALLSAADGLSSNIVAMLLNYVHLLDYTWPTSSNTLLSRLTP